MVADDGSADYKSFVAKNSASETKNLFKLKQRISIPVRDSRGTSVGSLYRSIVTNDKVPKYQIYMTNEGSEYGAIFGLYEAFEAILKTDTVYIVEGTMDAMALSLVVPNVVSTLTNFVNEEQNAILSDICSRKILVFDNDENGAKGSSRVMQKYSGGYMEKKLAFKDAGRGLEYFGLNKFTGIVKKSLGVF